MSRVSVLLVCVLAAALLSCSEAFGLGARAVGRAQVSASSSSSAVLKVQQQRQQRSTQGFALRDTPKYDIVPLDKENVENAASVTGGILGLVVLGPFGGLLAAALSNWLVKKDNEGGEALRGVGTSIVNLYNYVTKVNAKFDISTKITTTVADVVEKSAPEAKSSIDENLSKVSTIVSEYDLVTKGKALAKASADLSEVALEKLDELNTKYDFVETTKKAVGTVVAAGSKAINDNKSE